MDEILTNTLSSLHNEFHENELAFLALSTKIELPLRDRWAYSLYRDLFGKYVVSREWKRTDLAILNRGKPEALIELKAMYTFDAVLAQEGVAGFSKAMEKDEKKALALANGIGSVYTVLLATHPKRIITTEYAGIIKYRRGINRAIKRFGSEEQVAKYAKQTVHERLKHKCIIANGSLSCGMAYEVPTEVYYWIIKA